MELQAKDLRVGNWLHNKSKNFLEVKEIDFRMVLCQVNRGSVVSKYGVSDVKPIPLTEEYMPKFKDSSGLKILTFKDGSVIAISLRDYSFGLYSSISMFGVGSGYNSKNKKIKFVHQLQNLMQDLGEELTIK